MTVVVKYVVVRNGKEVMTFATKKEADAHDKQLDIAESLHEFLLTAKLDIADDQLDELAFFMARHRDQMIGLLRGSAPRASAADKPDKPDKPASAKSNKAGAGTAAKSARSANKPEKASA